MSNPGILTGFTNIPAQTVGRVVIERRYGNHQFNIGDLGKTLALQYQSGLTSAFYLPHDNQGLFEFGAVISGYNANATNTLTITPRSGVSIYMVGRTSPLSTFNIVPRGQFVLVKELAANVWLASGTGVY